jgi:hypothetical protein
MITRRPCMTLVRIGTFLVLGLATAAPARAHCDSMDGPVVTAARAALASGEVALVLPWVRAEDEAEIREAFERTLRVRTGSAEARELADLWFFETLVRVHRMGEGEPYTGLKPAGWQAPALIAAADRSLEEGTVDALAARVSDHVARELRERYGRAVQLKEYAPDDVAAGRRYVEAYVAYTHYLEALHHLLHGEDGHDAHAAREPHTRDPRGHDQRGHDQRGQDAHAHVARGHDVRGPH